jgi:SAM-dependent methyltransferase
MGEFICNICGATCRETICASCGASLHDRAILHVLSIELFGISLMLPDFPRIRSLRGLGISDSHIYADRLAARFDYHNTFYEREPRFDIAAAPPEEFGRYDFLICSEIFEHIRPPVEHAFENACRLLKPNGVLVLTTPYTLYPSTAEHYPGLHEFGLAKVGDRLVLVNRTSAGEVQVFENPVFHVGCSGDALEMREFSESDLKAQLMRAGFHAIRIHSEDDPAYGIVRKETWSLPIAARKGEFSLGADATREVMEHWREVNRSIRRLGRTYWFRVGRKLGLV